jgi:prephenate dehydrogenase
MLVGIIGGTGAMGRLFTGIFERAGHRVITSGRHTEISNTKLAEQADLVMVSVPIRNTVDVILEIAPILSSDQVLCDLTSLKEAPIRAMLKSDAHVIGLHPMFGPNIPSLLNQTIIATPARCDPAVSMDLLSIFRNEGAIVTITTPEVHDRMMAVVQGLTHFATLALAETMRKLEIDPGEMIGFTSPVYRIEMGLIGRILSQETNLYGDILQCNPAVPQVLLAFRDAAASLHEDVLSGDPERFSEFFRHNQELFEEYIPKAVSETDIMIKALVDQ